jgi:hypothetical protein
MGIFCCLGFSPAKNTVSREHRPGSQTSHGLHVINGLLCKSNLNCIKVNDYHNVVQRRIEEVKLKGFFGLFGLFVFFIDKSYTKSKTLVLFLTF